MDGIRNLARPNTGAELDRRDVIPRAVDAFAIHLVRSDVDEEPALLGLTKRTRNLVLEARLVSYGAVRPKPRVPPTTAHIGG